MVLQGCVCVCVCVGGGGGGKVVALSIRSAVFSLYL